MSLFNRPQLQHTYYYVMVLCYELFVQVLTPFPYFCNYTLRWFHYSMTVCSLQVFLVFVDNQLLSVDVKCSLLLQLSIDLCQQMIARKKRCLQYLYLTVYCSLSLHVTGFFNTACLYRVRGVNIMFNLISVSGCVDKSVEDRNTKKITHNLY